MKKRLLTLICILFSIIAFTQSVPHFLSDSSIENASWQILVKSPAVTPPTGSGLSINSSSAVQFGTVVCANSDNNSLLIHLNIK